MAYFDFLALVVDGDFSRYAYPVLVDVIASDGFCELVYVVRPRGFLSRHSVVDSTPDVTATPPNLRLKTGYSRYSTIYQRFREHSS